MTMTMPELFFRTRENGALVFRVDTQNRQNRMELDQIAAINIKNGEIKPHTGREITEDEERAIQDWITERNELLAQRDLDDIERSIDHLNRTTHWAQSRATEEQLEQITDRLLLTMHDLRSVLVRKKTDRFLKKNKAEE